MAETIERSRELLMKCLYMKAKKCRKLKPIGTGALLDEQQYCFEKGYREGAKSVRKNIRELLVREDIITY